MAESLHTENIGLGGGIQFLRPTNIVPIPYYPSLFKHKKFVQTDLKAVSLLSYGVCCSAALLWGRLKRSARAVQLFGCLAVLETHALRY